MANSSNTYSVSSARVGNEIVEVHQWDFVADDGNGSVPDAVSTNAVQGFVMLGVTNPGTTAPQDNYDITLADDDSCDVFGAELTNRDTAVSEQAMPKIGSYYGERYVNSVLTMALAGNNVNSATGTLKVNVRRLQ